MVIGGIVLERRKLKKVKNEEGGKNTEIEIEAGDIKISVKKC